VTDRLHDRITTPKIALMAWMALNTFERNCLTPLHFKRLKRLKHTHRRLRVAIWYFLNKKVNNLYKFNGLEDIITALETKICIRHNDYVAFPLSG